MSSLAEIEAAADALPPEQKQELMLFLSARLRAAGARLPEPRQFSREQMAGWARLRPALLVMDYVLTLELPVVFPVKKDRPILFSALAWADVLLTLDRRDFGELLNQPFYGLPILKPGIFLEHERAAGRLR